MIIIKFLPELSGLARKIFYFFRPEQLLIRCGKKKIVLGLKSVEILFLRHLVLFLYTIQDNVRTTRYKYLLLMCKE